LGNTDAAKVIQLNQDLLPNNHIILADQVVRSMYPEGYKSLGQKEAIEAAVEISLARNLNRQLPFKHVLTVLPTSAGKSLIMFVLANLKRSLGVLVVCPLVTLINELITRAGNFGIKATKLTKHLTQRELQYSYSMIFVTPEQLGRNTLTLERLKSRSYSSIVVDECHQGLSNFRNDGWNNVKNVHDFQLPLFLLTGTCPPVLQTKLLSNLFLLDDTDCKVIRQGTIRTNLQIDIHLFNNTQDRKQQGRDIALQAIAEETVGNKKAIVFCRTKQDMIWWLNELQNRFPPEQCLKYESSDKTDKHAAARLEAYQTSGSEMKFLAATSVLGAGIDIPDVAVIVHDEPARELSCWYQGAGRAARTPGSSGLNIILHARDCQTQSKEDYREVEAMDKILAGDRCINGIVSSYLDNKEGICSTLGVNPSLRCRPCQLFSHSTQNPTIDLPSQSPSDSFPMSTPAMRSSPCCGLSSSNVPSSLPTATAVVKQNYQSQWQQDSSPIHPIPYLFNKAKQYFQISAKDNQLLQELVKESSNPEICAYCLILLPGTDNSYRTHSVSVCHRWNHLEISGELTYFNFKRSLKCERNTCCFKCLRPMDDCPFTEKTSYENTNKRCTAAGGVHRLLFAICKSEPARQRARENLNAQKDDISFLTSSDWLGTKTRTTDGRRKQCCNGWLFVMQELKFQKRLCIS
jgi:hypothetical protein